MTRITNVPERLKEVPAHALRAVFAGIGQALLVSDRVRRKLMSAPDAAEDAREKAGRHAVRVPVTRPAAVKAATREPVTPAAKRATVTSATKTAQASRSRVTSATKPADGMAPAAKAPEPASPPPIPNYDELSVASLRARLRGLDVAQVRVLLSYERSRGSRSDVITMYERRIAKLTETHG